MAIRDLVPFNWGAKNGELTPAEASADPFWSLQRDVNALFDSVFRGWPAFGAMAGAGDFGFVPSVDVRETDKTIEVSADLPGMSEKDLDLSLSPAHDALLLRGERKVERKDEGRGWHRVERSTGAFHRAIPLPAAVEPDRIEATFKSGVLHVTLPKKAGEARGSKRIPVKSA